MRSQLRIRHSGLQQHYFAGRLTLHILLSFAQFEREIISERTRDKLSATRRKGKWIGGYPVLDYDIVPQGGKLVVNEEEAGQVREMFRICQEAGSLHAAAEIRKAGLHDKGMDDETGKAPFGETPGQPFAPAHALKHPLYRIGIA